MSDLQKSKNKHMKKDPAFWKDYDKRFETFQISVLLKQARNEAGMTQEQIPQQLQTTKCMHGLYVKPLSSRRLLHYIVGSATLNPFA